MESEKYSLRQRRKIRSVFKSSYNTNEQNYYQLMETVETKSKSKTKTKSKSVPLSKYRRRTANARERNRMHEINVAFETLRQCVPLSLTSEDVGITNEKLTKITTLRLAMKYIKLLTETLTDPELKNLQRLYNEIQIRKNLNADIHQNQPSKSQKPNQNKYRKVNHNRVKSKRINTTPRQNKRNKCPIRNKSNCSTAQVLVNPELTRLTGSGFSLLSDKLDRRKLNKMNCNQVFLESDGESLNLSEICLSPMQDNSKSTPLLSNASIDLYTALPLVEIPATDPIIATATSLQSPLYCYNPLFSFDAINPFDLYHPDLPVEEANLDLFLS